MKRALIKCDDEIKLEKVKLLLERMGTAYTNVSDDHLTIECTLPEKRYKYIKHKWTVGVTVIDA
jgi:hypothetical protein